MASDAAMKQSTCRCFQREKELPRNIFLRLVDIITDEEVRRVAGVVRR